MEQNNNDKITEFLLSMVNPENALLIKELHFRWKEYLNQPVLNPTPPQIEEKESDYEIISWYNTFSNTIQEKPFVFSMPVNYYVIYSVLRNSDNQIFTVGDKINDPFDKSGVTIQSIQIDSEWQGGIRFNDKSNGTSISTARKIKTEPLDSKPLFTTEDGVDIYSNSEYWSVEIENTGLVDDEKNGVNYIPIYNGKWYARKYDSHPIPEIKHKRFSTKQSAENWILLNKPCLSYLDVVSRVYDINQKDSENLMNKVKEKIIYN